MTMTSLSSIVSEISSAHRIILNRERKTQSSLWMHPAKIVIYKFAGAIRYLHLNTNRGRLQVGTGGNTKGHNASGAANAFCVAAAPAARSDGGPGSPNGPFPGAYNSNSKVETFSSDGFRRIFFNANGGAITPGNFTATGGRLLIKPDITAADGVVTTLPFDSGLKSLLWHERGRSSCRRHCRPGALAQAFGYAGSSPPSAERFRHRHFGFRHRPDFGPRDCHGPRCSAGDQQLRSCRRRSGLGGRHSFRNR